MNTEPPTTTSNIATLPAPTEAQTSSEVIQANVHLLIEQLEAGHSEGLTAYLTAMGDSTTTASETSWRLHDRSRTQPALQVCMRGTSLAARS